jgi:hypothetical protein
MDKDISISIRRVANGFIVDPAVQPGMCISSAYCHVFNDLASLCEWLKQHYPEQIKTA